MTVLPLALINIQVTEAQTQWAATHTRAHNILAATFVRDVQDEQPVEIVVALQMRNLPALATATSRRALRPRALTPVQVTEQYGPTDAQARQVAQYLGDVGFTNIRIAPNRLLIEATGTAATVRAGFNTRLAVYARGGREGMVNTEDVSVPVELQGIVLAVLGLQTLDQFRPMSGTLQVVNPSTQLAHVYQANNLPAATNTVVGIIADGNLTQTLTDLSDFEAAYSLPSITTSVVKTGPGPWSDTSGTEEWDLDSQTIQSMAHNVREMIFYDATGTAGISNSALATAINAAVTAGAAKVVNISLVECETSAYTDGTMATIDQELASGVLQGQTFSVASGDTGAYECGTGGVNGSSYGSMLGDSYPASSPYVVAVGGTSLYTNDSGGVYSYASESAWAYGGGGPSAYESRPAWQNGVVSGSYRGVPDLAFDANPSSGIYIYFNGALTSTAIGGTSQAAPIFVGIWALIESGNNNAFGFAAPWLYHAATVSPQAFNDVTAGQNGPGTCPGIHYCAGAGWDYTSGWGSINASKLNTSLRGDLSAIIAAAIGQLLL
jgi:pseudomonalisin/xanthomonalisin